VSLINNINIELFRIVFKHSIKEIKMKFLMTIAVGAFISATNLAYADECVCRTVLQLPNGNSKVLCHKPSEMIPEAKMCKSFCENLGSDVEGIWGSTEHNKRACSGSGPI
jgi:hypothetical protein